MAPPDGIEPRRGDITQKKHCVSRSPCSQAPADADGVPCLPFPFAASGMMTEASSGERRLGREVLHLEKENWLLAGQERAAEKLEVAEDSEVYFEFLQ